jgi:hypothetical protein
MNRESELQSACDDTDAVIRMGSDLDILAVANGDGDLMPGRQVYQSDVTALLHFIFHVPPAFLENCMPQRIQTNHFNIPSCPSEASSPPQRLQELP